MLTDVLDALRCPACCEGFHLSGSSLRCPNGHTYDIARQGYVNLLGSDASPGTADTADMVAARADFLAQGHYDVVSSALAEAVSSALDPAVEGCVADVGAGTGHYLARVLDTMPSRVGVALDISKHAARRAAKAHSRLGAVVCDAWSVLPLRSRSAAVVLDVFAPRNAEEFDRVLAPRGVLAVVTPSPEHLAELVEPLGLLTVDLHKTERLDRALGSRFGMETRVEVRATIALTPSQVATVVAMGPSAHHLERRHVSERIAGMPESVDVTLAADITVWHRLGD